MSWGNEFNNQPQACLLIGAQFEQIEQLNIASMIHHNIIYTLTYLALYV